MVGQSPPLGFRKLWPADRARFTAHLLRLDAADRHMRFAVGVDDSAIRAYGERIDWLRTTILGCFADGELRGAAELVRAEDNLGGPAELALSVEGPFQDRGIGSALLARMLVIARNRFIATVHMVCLADNVRMRHIAAKFGARLSVHDGAVEGRIWLPWPSYLSLAEEAAGDGRAFVRAVFATLAPTSA